MQFYILDQKSSVISIRLMIDWTKVIVHLLGLIFLDYRFKGIKSNLTEFV